MLILGTNKIILDIVKWLQTNNHADNIIIFHMEQECSDSNPEYMLMYDIIFRNKEEEIYFRLVWEDSITILS